MSLYSGKFLLILGLLILMPTNVDSGPLCYAACMASIGVVGAVAGPALLSTLGFTSAGVAAGSWAASWMSTYGGNVVAGSLFSSLQSAGASWSVSGLCVALCANPTP